MQNQCFKKHASFCPFQRIPEAACEGSQNPSVEEVELRMGDFFHFGARFPGGKPEANQSIYQGLEVSLKNARGLYILFERVLALLGGNLFVETTSRCLRLSWLGLPARKAHDCRRKRSNRGYQGRFD